MVDKSNARVRRMFADIARRYDRMNHTLSLQVDRYWRWRTVRLVRPSGSAPILDVCTGTGDLAFAYRRKAGPAAVIGTDFCLEMLQVAGERRARRPHRGQLRFAEADTQQLPFEDNQFQIVSVAFGLRNVSDTALGLGEMIRVCRPGGRIAILEFSEPRRQPFKALYGWYFRHVLPRVGQWMTRNTTGAYEYLPQSVGEFPAGEALADMLRGAGLDEVAFRPLTLGVATLYTGTKRGDLR